MTKYEKMVYESPVTKTVEVRLGSSILYGSGQAGSFNKEQNDLPGSYGAGSFLSEDE